MDGPTGRKLIVIVEDNEHMADFMERALNDEPDYEAVAVHDGSGALETVRSAKASLILLDVMLPDSSGLQLYDILKGDPLTADIPVIFVTATDHAEEFTKRQITSYIAKPFELGELLDQVAQVCRASAEL